MIDIVSETRVVGPRHCGLGGLGDPSAGSPPPRVADHDGAGGGSGWSVRVDWPDGTHTLIGWARSRRRAERRARALACYWAGGPYRPGGYRIVAVGRDHWRAHATLRVCVLAGCP